MKNPFTVPNYFGWLVGCWVGEFGCFGSVLVFFEDVLGSVLSLVWFVFCWGFSNLFFG